MVIIGSSKQMEKTAEQLREFANEYNGIREQMLGEVANLATKWPTADNRVFTNKITERIESLQAMINAMNEAAEIIDAMRLNYLAQQQVIIDGLK